MKKLIAQRPILYMGRHYARGDTVPGTDPKMAEAWLRAGSVRELPENKKPNPKKQAANEGGTK